ncbi:MAG: chorismate pyruvate-lyase family protein, partial [Promethearchaeota archaeon]
NTKILNFHQTFESINNTINQVKPKSPNIMKILLSSNGSITRILQSIQKNNKCKIQIKTLNQIIMKLNNHNYNPEFLKLIDVTPTADFNFRKVILTDKIFNYAVAFSFTPIKRLKNQFKSDLIKADQPIGVLIDKHQLEIRRQIIKIHYLNDNNNIIKDPLEIKNKNKIPFRIYNIIHNKNVLMTIIEFFNPNI